MNKEEFIKELENVTNLNNEQARTVNNILESHFIIGKKNKEKIIQNIVNELNINEDKAEEIYESSMSIIGSSLKDKIMHPFKNQD